jgi:predicted DNA-binding transcriptional regulator AlpA
MDTDDNEFLRIPEIMAWLKVSRRTLDRIFATGKLRKRHIGLRCAGALRKDVIAYLQAR